MKPFKNALLPFLLFLSITTVSGQTKTIDNLKAGIMSAASEEEKMQAILRLCGQGYSLHPDTLMMYADNALRLAEKRKDFNAEGWANFYKSAALTNKGSLDSALNLAQKWENILQKNSGDPLLLANLINQKGRCFVRKTQYRQAMEMGYEVISIAEKNNDILLQVKGKTLIGWAYLEMGQHKEALNWHLQALHTTTDTLLLQKYAILFANLATNYSALGKIDSGYFYINKAIAYARKHENLFALSNSLAIASAIYVSSGKPEYSEPVLKEVVAIRKSIGDPFYTASDLAQLGYYYAHYGQPEKGIAACNEGIELARQFHLSTKLFFLYQSLADNYKALGKINEYSKVMTDIVTLKDSVYSKNSSDAVADLNAKYELQKKENTIIQQRLNIAQKTYWMYGGGILILFGVMLWYFNYKSNRRKQSQKMALALMEQKQSSERAILEAQEKERKRIAADLHDSLGAYAAAISSNVDIITADKNGHSSNAYEELKTNSQSIVSQLNDTIWVLTKERLALTAISDRLKVFIQRVGKSYPNVQIDVKENIEADRILAPMQALHLFKILQESIINALRHSGCTTIVITISSRMEWRITIEDNGMGMVEKAEPALGGNGLFNIKNRGKDAGWDIIWSGEAGAGTTVTIHPTTN